jgi:glycosyltransferase involved in cell wall biosynthesis
MRSDQPLLTRATNSINIDAFSGAGINIAVCGRFHYHNYVRYVQQAGLLNSFYYAHRRATDAASLGVAPGRAVNLWPKEYLIRLHGMLLRNWMMPQFAPLYGDLWQAGVLRRWEKCELLHVMLHGTALKLVRRAKQEGAKVIVEAVNQHPEGFNEILFEEAEHLGLKPRRTLHRIQERQIEEAAESDFLLAPSHIVRNSFLKRGYHESRIRVLPYGVDLARFHPIAEAPESDRTFRVICVAQVSPRKGQLYLLEAWKKLALPGAELLLIGAISDDRDDILRRYDGLFRHLPFVPNHQLVEHYARSSVFVLPSLEDGFAVATGEAMACGLPAITTVNNGAADVITHGIDGFVVPIRSAEAIAERLELLYRDKELRQEMSRAALAKARSEMSWETYANRLCAFYQSTFDREKEGEFPERGAVAR